jgi:hypothetical protein
MPELSKSTGRNDPSSEIIGRDGATVPRDGMGSGVRRVAQVDGDPARGGNKAPENHGNQEFPAPEGVDEQPGVPVAGVGS